MRPNAPLNVSTPNRSRSWLSTSSGSGAAPSRRRRRVRLGRTRVRHLGPVGVVGEQVRHRAERRRDRRADAVHLRPEVRHREPAVDRTAAAEHERAEHRGDERVVVEQRQRRPHHVVGGALPADADLARQRLVVVVAEHAALRRAGRAAGVDERAEVRRPDRRRSGVASSTASSFVPLVHRDLRGRRDLVPRARLLAVVDDDHVLELGELAETAPMRSASVRCTIDDPRAGVAELMTEVLALVRGVDRHRDRRRPVPRPTTTAAPRASSR